MIPPQPPTRLDGGGGGGHLPIKNSDRDERQPNIKAREPDTESARLLRSVGAFPSSIEELAGLSAELVERAIAYAAAEPGIASVAGWVVEALRRHRDEGWPIPAPRTTRRGGAGQDGLIDVAAYTGGAYGDLFRLGSDLTGLDAPACALEEHAFGGLAQPDAEADGAIRTRGAYTESFRLDSDINGLDASARGLDALGLGTPTQPDEANSSPAEYGEPLRQGSDLRGLEAPAPAQEPDAPAHSDASALDQPSQACSARPERRTDSPGATGDTYSGADPISRTATDSPVPAADAHRSANPSHAMATDAALTQELHAELLAQWGRRYRPIIAGLDVQTRGGTTLLICANVADMGVVQNELLGAIHGILARLGAPTQVVYTTHAGWAARQRRDGNAPSRPAAPGSPATA